MLDENTQTDADDIDAPSDLPGREESMPYAPNSLTDDLGSLYDDAKIYLEAEKRFQRSRVAFASDRAKKGVVFGLGAFAFLHLALIALVIGLVIALAPLITIWGAIALVFGVLLIVGVILGRAAAKKFGAVAEAFRGEAQEPDDA